MGKKEVCSSCGRDLSNVTNKYYDTDNNVLCEDCYKKKIKESMNREEINGLSVFTPKEGVILPNRSDYQDLVSYCMDYIYAVNASDLHLKTGAFPTIRKGGDLFKVCDEILSNEDVTEFVKKYYSGNENLYEAMTTVDYSFDYKDVRFRANFFHDLHGGCLALRLIKLFSVDFDKLGLPHVLHDLAMRKSGLILVTGPTGSGKSTSLAALLNYLNHHTNLHVLTLEDPIEYIHENNACVISQREIGRDCSSYDMAITELLREDPDMIMIGEMRDKKSIEAALRAVETGHIVLSTLHTRGAVSTISRIVDIFPSDQQDQIRTQLSLCLLCVCSQQLVPSMTKGEQVLATEVMVNTTPIAASIRDNRLPMITSLIQMGQMNGMHTMKSALDALLKDGKITEANWEKYQIV